VPTTMGSLPRIVSSRTIYGWSVPTVMVSVSHISPSRPL
jgi:hypothetical protein